MEQANGQRLYNGAKSGARDTHPAPPFLCYGEGLQEPVTPIDIPTPPT